MQAYSQIVDPTQKIGDLRSLGRRLKLPTGWRFRSRVLRRPLAVGAPGGKATITQDELQNTYQLARTTRAPGRRKRHRVSLDAKTKSVPTTQPGTIEDRGSIRGTPFGRGTATLNVVLGAGQATGTVRLLYPNGSITGSFDMAFSISGGEIDFKGTARFTAGTGVYRGITSGALAAHDHNTLDGQNGVVSVDGFARY